MKKISRRQMLKAMAATPVIGTLAACGSAESGSAAAGTADAASSTAAKVDIQITETVVGNVNAPIEITWQPCPIHFLTMTTEEKTAYLKPRMQEWCEAHPDVKFTIIDTAADIGGSMTKTLVQCSEGTAADIISIDSYIFPRFHPYVQPIGEELKACGLDTDDFYPYVSEGARNDAGDILGLWYTTDVRFLFYRKDLMDAPPTTWDELEAQCKELADAGVPLPFTLASTADESTMTDTLLPMFFGQGGDLFDDAGVPIFGEGANREIFVKILTFIKGLYDQGYISTRCLTAGSTDFYPDHAAKSIGLTIGSNYNRARHSELVGGYEAYDELWDISKIPMPEKDQFGTTAGGWISGVVTDDPQKKALCVDFIHWLYGAEEAMAGFCSAAGYLPTRPSVYETSEEFTTPYMQKCGEELKHAFIRPSFEIYSGISSELVTMFGNVMTEKIGIEEGLDKAFKAAMQLYNEQ